MGLILSHLVNLIHASCQLNSELNISHLKLNSFADICYVYNIVVGRLLRGGRAVRVCVNPHDRTNIWSWMELSITSPDCCHVETFECMNMMCPAAKITAGRCPRYPKTVDSNTRDGASLTLTPWPQVFDLRDRSGSLWLALQTKALTFAVHFRGVRRWQSSCGERVASS